MVEIGRKYGKLKVLSLNKSSQRGKTWVCECDCGKEIVLASCYLLGTKTRRPNKSCGCSEKRYNKKLGKHLRVYELWRQMVRRCHNESAINYERYGEKGIYVTDEWKNDFETFLDWALKNGYKDDLSIDRIDPSKPYEPYNCRWVDNYVQTQNRGMLKSNKTGVNGVAYSPKQNHYRAYITRYGVRKNLGCFKTLEEAKDARGKAEEYFEKYGTIKDL